MVHLRVHQIQREGLRRVLRIFQGDDLPAFLSGFPVAGDHHAHPVAGAADPVKLQPFEQGLDLGIASDHTVEDRLIPTAIFILTSRIGRILLPDAENRRFRLPTVESESRPVFSRGKCIALHIGFGKYRQGT